MNMTATLIDEAHKRWPDVYTEEWCNWAVVQRLPDDPAAALYRMRELLLAWAKVQCSRCRACPLQESRFKESVWADGGASASIFVIGDGPDQYDQRTLVPFTSQNELRSSRCLLECPNFRKCFPYEYLENHRALPHRQCDIPTLKSGRRIQDPERNARLSGNLKPPAIHTAAGHLSSALAGGYWRDSWNSTLRCQEKPPTLSRLFLTNLVKCRSCENGQDKAPLTSNCKACRKWLDIQLAIVQPRVVISLGSTSGVIVTGDKGFKMKQRHGDFYRMDAEKRASCSSLPSSVAYVGHLFHPSYLEKGQVADEEKARIVKDMKDMFAKAYVASERKVQ